MKQLLDLLIILTVFALISCNLNVAGKVDEQDVLLPGLISMSGAPVAGAKVKIYKSGDSTGLVIDSTETNDQGKYSLAKIPNGVYSIWAKTDSSVLYKDSIIISKNSSYNATDTLKLPRTIVVRIKVEPQDLPTIVSAHLQGTDLDFTVDKNSYLTLDSIPYGKFYVRLTPNSPDLHYTAKNWKLLVNETTLDTLDSTWSMEYTGIPVVTGIVSVIDTATGIATIRWNRSDFTNFDQFQIRRETVGVPNSDSLIAVNGDTTISDNLNAKNLPSASYIYRVVIRGKSGKVGDPYFSDTIRYVNPKTELNMLAGTIMPVRYDQAATIPCYISPWFGKDPQISFTIGGSTFVALDPGTTSIYVKQMKILGDSIPLILQVIGNGRIRSDTLYLNSTINWVRTGSFPSTGTYLSPLVDGSTVILPVVEKGKYKLFKSLDSCLSWQMISDSAVATFDTAEASNPVMWSGKLWIVDGSNSLFSSLDGSLWTKESVSPVAPDWDGSFERKTLGVTANGLELMVDNSSDNINIGTTFSFWRYNLKTREFEKAFVTNEKSLKLYNYWVENSSQGFRLYTVSKDGGTDSIQRFSMFNSIVSDGKIPHSMKSVSPLRLSTVSFIGGILLSEANGLGSSLFVRSYSNWNKNTVPYKENVGDLSIGATTSIQYFAMGARIFAVNNGTVFSCN